MIDRVMGEHYALPYWGHFPIDHARLGKTRTGSTMKCMEIRIASGKVQRIKKERTRVASLFFPQHIFLVEAVRPTACIDVSRVGSFGLLLLLIRQFYYY